MSVDRYDTEYHLTPKGWVEGNSYYYGEAQSAAEAPQDRVLTMMHESSQSSAYSREEHSEREIWRSPSVSPDQIAELLKAFPRPYRLL